MNTKRNIFKICIVVAFTCCILTSCKKDEIIEPEVIDGTKGEVSIDVLKDYLFKTSNVDPALITFDEKRQMFIFFGIDQVSREDLTKYYQTSKMPVKTYNGNF